MSEAQMKVIEEALWCAIGTHGDTCADRERCQATTMFRSALAVLEEHFSQLESYRVTTEKLLDRSIPASEGPLEFVLCLMREVVTLRIKRDRLRDAALRKSEA